MKNQRDKLRQYQKRVRIITARETAVAKQCLAKGDKQRALLALRRKKYQESLLAQTDSQLEQLEKLTSSVEFALVQKDVLFGLKRGTEVLTLINKEMGGIEGVEKLVGENEEARRVAEEINQALAGQLSNQEEDEVEDELEALLREEEGVKLPSVPAGEVMEDAGKVDLPSVPNVDPTDGETEEQVRSRQKERAKQRRVALEAS